MRITRWLQHQRTLDSAKHVTLFGSPVGSEGGSCGRFGAREVRSKSFADAGPLGVAKHADQVKTSRDKRLERVVGRQGLYGARQWQRPSQAPAKLMPH